MANDAFGSPPLTPFQRRGFVSRPITSAVMAISVLAAAIIALDSIEWRRLRIAETYSMVAPPLGGPLPSSASSSHVGAAVPASALGMMASGLLPSATRSKASLYRRQNTKQQRRRRRGNLIKCRGWFDGLLNLGKKKVLVFRSAGVLLPKLESQLRGGEDAFFMSRLGGEEGVGDTSLLMKHSADGINKDKKSKLGMVVANLEAATVLGVADGVGSWSQYRIDPGIYAKQLMMNTARASVEISKKGAKELSAAELLDIGHSKTKLKGSTTTTVACLKGNTLSAATIGDTAFVLLRNGKIYFKSPTQEFEFDTPYQLADCDISEGFGEFSEPDDALLYTVRDIKPGDVLVMASDGLFDNLHDYEIEQIVAEKLQQGYGADGISRELIERARAHSLDPNYISPWAQEKGQTESLGVIGGTLRKLGIKAVVGSGYRGGKPDDISVITGIAQYLIPGTDLFLPI